MSVIRLLSLHNVIISRDKIFRDIPMTGDAQADADILAFLKARQTIVKNGFLLVYI